MAYITLVVIWCPVGRYCITCCSHCVACPLQLWEDTEARDDCYTQKKKKKKLKVATKIHEFNSLFWVGWVTQTLSEKAKRTTLGRRISIAYGFFIVHDTIAKKWSAWNSTRSTKYRLDFRLTIVFQRVWIEATKEHLGQPKPVERSRINWCHPEKRACTRGSVIERTRCLKFGPRD